MATSRRTATAIRFPEELHAELAQAAADRGLSINYLVCAAVRDFLPRLTPPDKFVLTASAPCPWPPPTSQGVSRRG